MGHDVITCGKCSAMIMEGASGTWDCDECGWWTNARTGESGTRVLKKMIWRLMGHLPVNNGLEDNEELFHVGVLGGQSGYNNNGSQEGPHLSISLHPDEWTMIAKLGGQNTYSVTRTGRQFRLLSYLEMESEHRDVLLKFAVQEGLLEPVKAYGTPIPAHEDDDEYSGRMYFETFDEAENEADFHLDEPDYPGIEEVDTYVASETINVYWSARHNEIHKLTYSGAVEAAICYLVEHYSDLDGVFFWEDFDPYAYSCPRGLIFQSRLGDFVATCDDEKIELKPDFRTMLRYPDVQFPKLAV